MIYTRSPYYVSIDATANPSNLVGYRLNLFVWKGLPTDKPFLPTYEFENNLINKKAKLNISNYINDALVSESFIETFDVEITNKVNNEVVNVAWEISLLTATNQYVPYPGGSDFAMLGYTYFEEGENYNIDDADQPFFTSQDFIRFNNSVLVGFRVYEAMNINVKSYPSGNILFNNYFFEVPNSSEAKTAYLNITNLNNNPLVLPTDKYIVVDIDGITRTYIFQDECKYKTVKIQFRNRFGMYDALTFFKKQVENIKIERSEYSKKSYTRQFVDYNTNARKELKLMSGFQGEEFNLVLEQLLLSESVFISHDGIKWDAYNIGTNSLTYKTRINDSLVNYEITFKQAYNAINNV